MKHSNDNAAEFAKIAEEAIRIQKERDKTLRLAIPGIEKTLIQAAENGDHEAFVPAQDDVVVDHLKKLGFKVKILHRVSTPLGTFFSSETNRDKIIARVESWKLKEKRLCESLSKIRKLIDRRVDLEGLLYAEYLQAVRNGSLPETIRTLLYKQDSIKNSIDDLKSKAILSVNRLTGTRPELPHLDDQDVINKIEWGVAKSNPIRRGANREVMLSPYLLNSLAEPRFKQLISGVIREIRSAAEAALMHTEIAIYSSRHGDKLGIVFGAYNNFSEAKDALIYILKHKGFKCIIKPDGLLISWHKKENKLA